MEGADVLLSVENEVATITLSQPDKLNAMTPEMTDKFARIIEEVRLDDAARVVLITGAGRGFCSGADVSGRPGAQPAKERWRMTSPLGQQYLSLSNLNKATIAAVNGVAAGLGLSIALACDIRIASEQARFSAVWVNRGLVPDAGATYYLPRVLGISRALEIMFTGDMIDAREAERIGLVSKVVSLDALMTTARELAGKIARKPSVAIGLMKRAAYRSLDNDLPSQLVFESFAQSVCRQTEDFKEGVDSFMQKRPPQFKGY